jgi:phthalate 4,5-dioxygenase
MWVPIDDDNTCVYNFMLSVDDDNPFTPEFVAAAEDNAGRWPPHGETMIRNRTRENDWLIDRAVQRTKSYTGIAGINNQDLAVQESMGRVADRSREHLGSTDRAVITCRQIMLDAVKNVAEGIDPPGVNPASYRGVRAADIVIPKDVRWQDVAEAELAARH